MVPLYSRGKRSWLVHSGSDFRSLGLNEITSLTLSYGWPPNVNCPQYRSRSSLVVGRTSRNGRFPPCATSSALVNGSSTISGGFAAHCAHRAAPPSTPCWNALTRSNPDPCAPFSEDRCREDRGTRAFPPDPCRD